MYMINIKRKLSRLEPHVNDKEEETKRGEDYRRRESIPCGR